MKFSVVTPLWQDRPAGENLEVAKVADKLGYDELWIGEMATYDAFALATAIGLNTRHIGLTIGPLSVSVRTPMTMAMGIASVADLTGRSTKLAIGASSNVVVEEWHGRSRQRTATHLGETARITRSLLAGEKAKFIGKLAACDGYRLRLNPTEGPMTIAAFSAAAVRTAAKYSDRMLLNMVSPGSVAQLRQQLDDAARDAQRPVPRLAAWLATAVDPDSRTIEQMLRAKVGYLAAPGYGEMFIEAGFGDLVKFARTRPHPKELLAAMPAELIAVSGLIGDSKTIEQRLEDYRQAGLDEICIVPATAGDPAGENTLKTMQQCVVA